MRVGVEVKGSCLSFVALSLELTEGSKFTTSTDESAKAQPLLGVDLKGSQSEAGFWDEKNSSPATDLRETSLLKSTYEHSHSKGG